MLRESLGDLHGVLLRTVHAEPHGFDAAQEQEALEGCQGGSLRVLQEGHTMRQLGIAHADQA